MKNPQASPLPQSIRSIVNGIELFTGTIHVRVQFTADGAVHVVKWLQGSRPKKGSLIVIPRSLPKLKIVRTEDSEACTLTSKRIRVHMARKSGEIRYSDALGVPIVSEKDEATITPAQIENEAKAFSVRQAFHLSAD